MLYINDLFISPNNNATGGANQLFFGSSAFCSWIIKPENQEKAEKRSQQQNCLNNPKLFFKHSFVIYKKLNFGAEALPSLLRCELCNANQAKKPSFLTK